MRGELLGVWSETWRDLWEPLAAEEAAPDDLYCELYRELSTALKIKPTAQDLADIIDNSVQAKDAFRRTTGADLAGERALVVFFERTHEALDDLAGDSLANPYFNLLVSFIDKFSLRYDLRRPCQLCPTVPGVFAGLFRELRTYTVTDAHLDSLMKEFESAVRDLRSDSSEGKIKTCIQKQVNLLEAVGGKCPAVTAGELGGMCSQLPYWPHAAVSEALKKLYGFTSDYPGIRHGGNPGGVRRNIEMRDMVAMCVLLTGFSPYLTDKLNADLVYRGT